MSLIAAGVVFSAVLGMKTGTGAFGFALLVIGTILLIYGIKQSKK